MTIFRIIRLGLVSCVGLQLVACEAHTAARFAPFEVTSPRNLTEVLGTAGQLVGPDTTSFVLRYDPQTMLNSFSLVTAADTVPWFAARAFRYRGLYYLVTPGRDSVSSWVHAARITTRSVQGLGTDYSQMQDLSAAVKDGQFAELVRFRNFSADSVVLRFDKVALHRFYRTLPDSFPAYRVVPGRAAVSAPTAACKQPVNHSFTVYPNPATEAATVQFTQPAPRTIQVLDEAGREILVVSSSETVVNLPLSNVKAGSYLVRVAADQALPQFSRRLLVVK